MQMKKDVASILLAGYTPKPQALHGLTAYDSDSDDDSKRMLP